MHWVWQMRGLCLSSEDWSRNPRDLRPGGPPERADYRSGTEGQKETGTRGRTIGLRAQRHQARYFRLRWEVGVDDERASPSSGTSVAPSRGRPPTSPASELARWLIRGRIEDLERLYRSIPAFDELARWR